MLRLIVKSGTFLGLQAFKLFSRCRARMVSTDTAIFKSFKLCFLLVKFYCKEKWAACFGAIFLTGTVYTPCSQDFASTILKFLKHANSPCLL